MPGRSALCCLNPGAWEESHTEEEEGPRMSNAGRKGDVWGWPTAQSFLQPLPQASSRPRALLSWSFGSGAGVLLRGGPRSVRGMDLGLGPVGTGTWGVSHVHSSLDKYCPSSGRALALHLTKAGPGATPQTPKDTF